MTQPASLDEYEFTVGSFENGYVTRVTGAEEGVFVTTGGLPLRRSADVAAALGDLLE